MIDDLIQFLADNSHVNDKSELAELVSKEFNCIKDRSVYATDKFAIRFSKGQGKSSSLSNTILSLSALQKYDDRPFIVCICGQNVNHLLLANTSLVAKISHSSKALRTDNIKGSFNGSDILRVIDGITNEPKNFDTLFSIHQNTTFEENLTRLVEATNEIAPRNTRWDVTIGDRLPNILASTQRASDFSKSADYSALREDLQKRVSAVEDEILVAACIENVNLRGRIIEYLIAGESEAVKNALIEALTFGDELPRLVTRDGIGDYRKDFPNYVTETDIKTKILILASAPKGYNIDKMLEFLSEPNSVFLIFFIGIDYESRKIRTKLMSMFQSELIGSTVVQTHWSGRSSRGTTQFNGETLKKIIFYSENNVDITRGAELLNHLITL